MLARVILIVAAVGAAAVPLPARFVETWYSSRLYPALQHIVTPWSNRVPVALLDIAVGILLVALAVVFARRVRARGWVRGMTSTVGTLVTLTAVLVLIFFITWGFNYRRQPLEAKLEYDAQRVTRERAIVLGEHAVKEVNALSAEAHDVPAAAAPTLEAAFDAAQRILGSARTAVPGLPKRSLLERYFRAAAIDGMTDPFFLEIVINPEALPFERPFVVAHEWAHLAGYANEAEANFVAWLACTQGNAMARYSGWLAIFEHVGASLPRPDRQALASQLGEVPRRDLQASAARYARSSPVIRDTARDAYDAYLRANRVREGVASYSAVVRLILGAGLEEGRRPVLIGSSSSRSAGLTSGGRLPDRKSSGRVGAPSPWMSTAAHHRRPH
jgi:hypothetical protein